MSMWILKDLLKTNGKLRIIKFIMGNKILTIVIPTYNMEDLLERCLDSFVIDDVYMEQLEIIIVNDGSKDKSSVIAHNYQNKYPGIFNVIDKPNGNYGSCINAALKVAKGKYFRICDADDQYETKNLISYIDMLNSTDADIVVSPYSTMTFDGKYEKSTKVPQELVSEVFYLDDFDFYEYKMTDSLVMHCLCVKTALLRNNGYRQLEGISYTDTQFVFYSLLYSKTITFYDKQIYKYYLGRDGQTMSPQSLKKSYMHLYKNAENMVDKYASYKEKITAIKSKTLMNSIFLEIGTFYGVLVSYIPKPSSELALLNNLITKSKNSYNLCPIEERLMGYKTYKMWKKYHIPLWIIRKLIKTK